MDLETLDTQGLLDPADKSLDFVRRESNLKPMAIYRIENEFLLCYDGLLSRCVGHIILTVIRRVCVLRRQDRIAITEEVYGVLGRFPHWIR